MTIRRVMFYPYVYRQGPIFTLSIVDSKYSFEDDREYIHYRLRMKPWIGKSVILFEGFDFGCSPQFSIDSDETIASIMNFLTLRPRDTDQEYFENYTPKQLAYCDEHAELLGYEVYTRFGGDNEKR